MFKFSELLFGNSSLTHFSANKFPMHITDARLKTLYSTPRSYLSKPQKFEHFALTSSETCNRSFRVAGIKIFWNGQANGARNGESLLKLFLLEIKLFCFYILSGMIISFKNFVFWFTNIVSYNYKTRASGVELYYFSLGC